MRGVAIRVGILLAVIGFGSVILHAFTQYQFRYLLWAEGAQPYLGIGLGLVGLALVVVPQVRRLGAWEDSTPTVPFQRPTWPPRGY
jgi:hypothetical protein